MRQFYSRGEALFFLENILYAPKMARAGIIPYMNISPPKATRRAKMIARRGIRYNTAMITIGDIITPNKIHPVLG